METIKPDDIVFKSEVFKVGNNRVIDACVFDIVIAQVDTREIPATLLYKDQKIELDDLMTYDLLKEKICSLVNDEVLKSRQRTKVSGTFQNRQRDKLMNIAVDEFELRKVDAVALVDYFIKGTPLPTALHLIVTEDDSSLVDTICSNLKMEVQPIKDFIKEHFPDKIYGSGQAYARHVNRN